MVWCFCHIHIICVYIYIYRHTYMCYMTLDIHGHLLRRYDWTPKIYPKHRTSRGMTGCLGSKRSLLLQLSSGGWFQAFFMFTPKMGEDEPILTNILQMGRFNHQLVIFLPTLCLDFCCPCFFMISQRRWRLLLESISISIITSWSILIEATATVKWAPKTYMFRGVYGKQPGFYVAKTIICFMVLGAHGISNIIICPFMGPFCNLMYTMWRVVIISPWLLGFLNVFFF